MGGKKKPTSSAKKKRQKQRGQPRQQSAPPSLDEVLSQADAALDASDIETGLGLFTYASDVLRERIDGSTARASAAGDNRDAGAKAAVGTTNTQGTIADDVILLSRVLGKVGEARVSLGDPEGGRESFLEAINLLERGDDDDEHMDGEKGGGPSSLADSQLSEARASLHLYLGQLSSDREALDSYRSGVKELEKCVKILERLVSNSSGGSDEMGEEEGAGEKTSLENSLIETRRQLCGALCSIADLYMTDLCYDADAEEQCESALESAFAIDDGTAPDALQTRANLRLSQRRGDDAVRSILDAYGRISVGCEAMADLVGLGRDKDGDDGAEKGQNMSREKAEEKAKELVEVEAANSLPGFEFRCQSAKILLECAAYLSDDDGELEEMRDGNKVDIDNIDRRKSCIEASIQVLGSLLAENDEVVEVWYLLGCAFDALSPPDVNAAQYYWETALTMLTKVRGDMEKVQQGGDLDVDGESGGGGLDEVTEQMNEIKEKLAGLEEAKMSSQGAQEVVMDES